MLFADDTHIFFSDNDVKKLQCIITEELSVCINWFAANN